MSVQTLLPTNETGLQVNINLSLDDPLAAQQFLQQLTENRRPLLNFPAKMETAAFVEMVRIIRDSQQTTWQNAYKAAEALHLHDYRCYRYQDSKGYPDFRTFEMTMYRLHPKRQHKPNK